MSGQSDACCESGRTTSGLSEQAVATRDRDGNWTKQKRADRITAMLRTAAVVFAESGYEGASLEEIASRLEMRGPSLYHYFQSKEDLFLKCVETTMARVLGRLEGIAASTAPPEERLRLLFREQTLIELRDYPEFAPLFFRIFIPQERVRRRVLDLRRTHAQVFRAVAEEAAATVSGVNEHWKVGLFLGFGSLAYLQEWYDPDGPLPPEQAAEVISEMMITLTSGRPAADPAI